jgi:hypothetical protein
MVANVHRFDIVHLMNWVFSFKQEDSVDQIYNTNSIYICYQEKTQSIRYTIPTLSTYFTMRRLSQSDMYCISDELNLLMVIYVDRVGIVYLID